MSTIMMSGLEAADACMRRVRLFGLAADHQIGFLIDQQRQTLAHDGMIVNQEDTLLFSPLVCDS